jgi:hypothetical protein
MIAHSVVAAVSDRRRRSEIDATIYVALYNASRSYCLDNGLSIATAKLSS